MLVVILFILGVSLDHVFLGNLSLALLIFSPPVIAYLKVYFDGKDNDSVALDEKTVGKFNKMFVEPTERYVASIGNGYIVNFLADRTLSKGFAVVSDKRVYFKGKCYFKEDGKLKSTVEERMVDLKDVTGTGYTMVNPLYLLIIGLVTMGIALVNLVYYSSAAETMSDRTETVTGILFFACAPISVVALTMYILKRMNLFEISFAGGKIAFNTNMYDKSEMDDFQKQLRRAKDHIMESAATKAESAAPAAANAPEPSSPVSAAGVGIADELKKYAELLDQQLITKEEFEELKKTLIFKDKK